MNVNKSNQPCHLYRHFDKDGNLLYVGISISIMVRLSQHRVHSSWFREITMSTMEIFPTRELAAKEERKAILKEAPIYNFTFNQDSSRRKPRIKWKTTPGYTPRELELLKFIREFKEKKIAQYLEWKSDFIENYNRDFPSPDGEHRTVTVF